jgi:hypothetical protein
MKSLVYIVSTFLTLSFSSAFAAADSAPETTINTRLIPVVPMEATFEEAEVIPSERIIQLTPTVPQEADFSDSI